MLLLLALLALQAAPRGSGMTMPAPEACGAGVAAPLPPALAGWASRTPLAAAASSAGAAALAPGHGYDVALRPAGQVAFAAPPGKPAPAGGFAGLLSLSVETGGTYAVGLSSPAWIDVVDARGASAPSGAHGPGPPCSGVRKVVDFTLAPGRYTVQLTGGEPAVGVIAFRR